MEGLTERGRAFRQTIASFIESRREAKLKGKEDDAEAASKYEYATWLADAASRAHHLKVVTHPIKFTHSGIKGASSIHMASATPVVLNDVGTHCLALAEFDFAITDAKHLDVYSFLREPVYAKRLLDWIFEDDDDLLSALDENPEIARKLMDSFKKVFHKEEKFTSHPLAKQVYWLHGSDPTEDEHFHLLQPMFSSSLEHLVHHEIRSAREATFAARGTKKQRPSFADHSNYSGLVARVIGGSNAQNVSPQNKARGGVNYLLASLPPPAWTPRGTNLLAQDSALQSLVWFGAVRELINQLASFLRDNPDPVMETREYRDALARAIADEMAMFGATLRAQYEPGWSRDEACRLPDCEKLWLDAERSELPVRQDAAHPQWTADDEAFNRDYLRGDWPDEVATRFGLWLNQQLRDRGLTLMAGAEMRYWARLAVIDTAWPVPQQRRATEMPA